MDVICITHIFPVTSAHQIKNVLSVFFNKIQISQSEHPPPRVQTMFFKKHFFPNIVQISYYTSHYLHGYTEWSQIKEIQTKLV